MDEVREAPAYLAPSTNSAGVELALQQIWANGQLTHMLVNFDKDADMLLLRVKGRETLPSVSYSLPHEPDIMVRLDMKTAMITGIDFADWAAHSRTPQFSQLAQKLPLSVRWKFQLKGFVESAAGNEAFTLFQEYAAP